MWESLRGGGWLTRERLQNYPLILLAFAGIAIVAMVALTQDRLGPDNRPLGTDFSQVWVAGLETLRGHPEEPFDIARHIGEQHAEFGEKSAVYGWHYPPYFLGPAALLAHLPYLQALLVWQLATLLLYLAAIAAITRDSELDRARLSSRPWPSPPCWSIWDMARTAFYRRAARRRISNPGTPPHPRRRAARAARL